MVDGLERRLHARLAVARVDVGSDSGRALAARYGVAVIPAFVLLDARGVMLYLQVGGRPDEAAIERHIARAPAR